MHTKGLLITDSLFYERTLPFILGTIAIIIVLAIIAKYMSPKAVKRVFFCTFCAYIVGVLGITVFTRSPGETVQFEWNVLGSFQRAFQIVDGKLQYTTRDNIVELILNITLFIPFGFLLPGIVRTRSAYWNVIVVGILISFLIETTQYYLSLGQGELADVINNTVGVMIGVIANYYCIERMKNRRDKKC